MIIVAISGPIAAGKSSLTKGLAARGFEVVSTSAFMKAKLGPKADRTTMQAFGHELDANGPGWVADLINPPQVSVTAQNVVVDAVRLVEQVEAIRAVFGVDSVLHVHLTASNLHDLAARYTQRGEITDYLHAISDKVEASVSDLQADADLIIDTSSCTKEDTLVRVLARVHRTGNERFIDVLVGGQYGSEGKGHICAYLAPEYGALMRVGGPNAGHTVVYKGSKVSFYHLPSGLLHNPDALLLLGAGVNINPEVLQKEIKVAEALGIDVRQRLRIDKNANVILPEDIIAESELVRGIGSTGQGVGAASSARMMRSREPFEAFCKRAGLEFQFVDMPDELAELQRSGQQVMLEGTQGTGLSLYHGPYPFVTSRDTTASGTMGDAGIAPGRVRKVIMVVRTNPIRVESPALHTSGPMGKEISWDDVAKRAGVDGDKLRELERTTTTKRLRRVSEFDWVLLQRSAWLNQPTDLALTFTDYISPDNTKARRFESLTSETRKFIEEVETVANAPVSLITTRCAERSILDRRKW